MADRDVPPTPLPRNGAGSLAVVMGMCAVVFAFIPGVGEFVAVPASLMAIGLGLVGLWRVDKGIATNGGQAFAGSVLGIISGFIFFLVFAATSGL
ncbi:MAG TPA: hypothetical protein VFZ85_20635 [Jiangellaceae bacterium]